MSMSSYQLNKNCVNRITALLLLLFLFSFPLILHSQNEAGLQKQATSFDFEELSAPNPSLEANALYKYLQNIFGEKILSGQMSTPQGIKEVEYIMNVTGKNPAIRGFDLASEKKII